MVEKRFWSGTSEKYKLVNWKELEGEIENFKKKGIGQKRVYYTNCQHLNLKSRTFKLNGNDSHQCTYFRYARGPKYLNLKPTTYFVI